MHRRVLKKILAVTIFVISLNSCSNSKDLKLKELNKVEYLKTMSNKMINVTLTAEPIVDIWKYAEILKDEKKLPKYVVEKHLVEYVYRNDKNTFDHILLRTSKENIFIAIIINIQEKKIFGHYQLNINEEYSLN
jgi:hypothetical protein